MFLSRLLLSSQVQPVSAPSSATLVLRFWWISFHNEIQLQLHSQRDITVAGSLSLSICVMGVYNDWGSHHFFYSVVGVCLSTFFAYITV